MIHLAMELASSEDEKIPMMPYPECGAMSQGYIGYHLQQAIGHELELRNINKNVSTIITQVIVDEKDEAFNNPTKPIGRFYTKEEADDLAASHGAIYVEDAGRGYRRVVASPAPKEIVEIETVKQLSDMGNIVITVGGGGIPIIRTKKGPKGVMAVIDKDKSAALLAKELNADVLMILTAVDKVCLNYGKENEEKLDCITVDDALKYIQEEQFAKGSMLPKVTACMDFVTSVDNGTAYICALSDAKNAIEGRTGTKITR